MENDDEPYMENKLMQQHLRMHKNPSLHQYNTMMLDHSDDDDDDQESEMEYNHDVQLDHEDVDDDHAKMR